MDALFWEQAYGDKEELLDSISDSAARRFAEINYGPWDRLEGNERFMEGAGNKPKGANFYPQDMTKEEFEAAAAESAEKGARLKSLYTMVRRDDEGGFRVEASWTVSGSVNHFGHVHYRQNRYDATLLLHAVEGAWKIRAIEILDQRRIL